MDKIEEVLTRGVEKIYPNKKALETELKRIERKLKTVTGVKRRRELLQRQKEIKNKLKA